MPTPKPGTGSAKPPGKEPASAYPLPAFYFKIVVSGLPENSDTSFQEVRGITSEVETEDIVEGGENRFVHRLPKSVKHPQLEMKRGITTADSKLADWCRSVFESGWSEAFKTAPITVYLLDGEGNPARGWTFADCYPVKWEIDDFTSTKNEVAIETLVFSYTYSNKIL